MCKYISYKSGQAIRQLIIEKMHWRLQHMTTRLLAIPGVYVLSGLFI